MTESQVHRTMKSLVRRELEQEGYTVVEEPALPPGRVRWTSYRPDLLVYWAEGEKEHLALVECETRPDMRRLGAKNFATVWFQPLLHGEGSLRRILAVPQGRLHSVDMTVREGWEVWVTGRGSVMTRFSRSGSDPAGDVSRNRKRW